MRESAYRRFGRLALDLCWVVLAAFLAIAVRENFRPSLSKLEGVALYSFLCVISALAVFSVARLNRSFWRYVSLVDVLHVIAAVTVALLLAVLAAFVINRLEGVARSVPVIQWFLVVTLMVGTRVTIRLIGERRSRNKDRPSTEVTSRREHVLVVGVGDLTELYLRSVDEFASNVVIVGILTGEPALQGRSLRMRKVLGIPKDIQQVLDQLEVHGVPVERIVVTEAFESLSKETQAALRYVERGTAIKVDWLVESLGLRPNLREGRHDARTVPENENAERGVSSSDHEYASLKPYHGVKRAIDAAAATVLAVVLVPILALTALLVAIDVGLPLVFWQQRPGRFGWPFRLFKFRTMRSAHDSEGNRIPDELRSSSIGRFLRRTWLDETPQLYNILVGEMSFVGPRPLLPIDQPEGQTSRLLVRPGLTGLAQINGGRDIPPAEKAAFDLWYIENASLWVDFRILLRTVRLMVLDGGPDSCISKPIGAELETKTRRAAYLDKV